VVNDVAAAAAPSLEKTTGDKLRQGAKQTFFTFKNTFLIPPAAQEKYKDDIF
jgi:hypothetical protein